MSDARKPRILVADDQRDVLAALKLLLKGEGYSIQTATSPTEVAEFVQADDFDVLLLDLNYTRDTTSGPGRPGAAATPAGATTRTCRSS